CGRRWRGSNPRRMRGLSPRREPLTRLRFANPPSPTRGEGASVRRLFEQPWMAGSSPAKTVWTLGEVNQPDPVGDQSGLVLTLDLDDDIGARLKFLRLAQFRFDQCEPAADAR